MRKPPTTLDEKIQDDRRKRRYREVIRQLRLRYFVYEDQSEAKAQKSVDLITKIHKMVLKPCSKCGADS